MATHRRGLRPSQWPVRDLLGPDRERVRLWDARIGAAVAGLLACGAAVTVVVTSGETSSGSPADASRTGTPPAGPLALPPPTVDPAPAAPPSWRMPPAAAVPAPVVPPARSGAAPAAPAPRVTPPSSARSGERPVTRPRRTTVPARPAEPTLAEQVAAGIEQWERRSPDRPVIGWLVVPLQRPADAAALLELACPDCDDDTGGRHRAADYDVERSPDGYRDAGRHRAPDPDDDRSGSRQDRDDQDRDDQDRDDQDRDDQDRDDRDRDDRDRDGDRDRDEDRDERDRDDHDEASDDEPEGSDDDGPRPSDDEASDDDGDRDRDRGHDTAGDDRADDPSGD